jgi:hypothetical protein
MTEIILFLFFVIFLFYLPGTFIAEKLKLELKPIEDIFFNTTVGLLFFTLVSYIFSWIKIDYLILPLFLIIDYLAIKNARFFPRRLEKMHVKPIILVLVFSFIFSLSMLTTGKFGDIIIYGRDDLWHLALINELKNNFPPDNPGFAGIPLKGYHFFYNFVVAKISNIFHIAASSLHFHFIPVFLAILTGLGTYSLVFKWSKKIGVSLWAVFLTMFGGSFSYVLALLGRELSLTSGLSISQPIFTLYNPPLAISIVILLSALFALFQYLSTQKKKWLIPFVLSAGLISMFKVYAGMILIGGFIFITFLEVMKRKFTLLTSLFVVAIIFFATYWVFAGGAGYLIFYPLWPSQRLLLSLPWYGYHEKITTYTQQQVIRGVLETEAYGLFLFLIGGLGTRIIGILLILFIYVKKRILPSSFSFTIIVMTLISILTPLFFIQSGKVFEIIQMTHYFVFFVSIFAAFGFAVFFEMRFSKIVKILLASILILLTIPNAYFVLKEHFSYLNNRSKTLSSHYFQAMKFLSEQGSYNLTILEIPPKSVGSADKDINDWYLKVSNPSVVAFANKRSFLSNQFIEFPGIDREVRLEFLKKVIIFNQTDATESAYPRLKREVAEGLSENEIKFIYSPYELFRIDELNEVNKIYQKENETVYKVN